MDGANNLLDLARSAAIPTSPYHPNASAGVSSISTLVSGSSAPQDSLSMRSSRLNGWSAGYNASDPATASMVGHHGPAGTNFPSPYASSLAGAGTAMPTKPGYSSFASGSEFLANQCQQVQLNQLSPLNSLPQRHNFSAFYGDMYNPNPSSMGSGGFFSDLGLPSIPRFDADGASGYMADSNNPGNFLIISQGK